MIVHDHAETPSTISLNQASTIAEIRKDGMRESKASWADVRRDLKRRGLVVPPKLAVGNGALGFWAALEEVFKLGMCAERSWRRRRGFKASSGLRK